MAFQLHGDASEPLYTRASGGAAAAVQFYLLETVPIQELAAFRSAQGDWVHPFVSTLA